MGRQGIWTVAVMTGLLAAAMSAQGAQARDAGHPGHAGPTSIGRPGARGHVVGLPPAVRRFGRGVAHGAQGTGWHRAWLKGRSIDVWHAPRHPIAAPPTLWRTERPEDEVGRAAPQDRGYRAGPDRRLRTTRGGGSGLETYVPGIGTYVGGFDAQVDPGNGRFFAVEGAGSDTAAAPAARAGGARIVRVTPELGEAACRREAGVCVVRP